MPTPSLPRADACISLPKGTVPRKRRKFSAPFFRVQASVHLFLTESTSCNPDATVRVDFLVSHQGAVHCSGREQAQTVFRRFGVDQKILDTAYYTVDVDGYTAQDARYMRNPVSGPVEAFYFCKRKDEARLIKQRRLVPESYADIARIYGPQAAAAVPEGGAA